uniref:Conserved oligomeric Golgi complex subunit 5 n=1 Tax=Ciona savignyi TaxID=51511 RepID=H2YD78_CIOSA
IISSQKKLIIFLIFPDVLADFLKDEFDVQDYATKVIENAAISQRLAQLMDGISMLDKQLQSQITSRHEDLLAQATGIESLEGILTMMQTRINSLQSVLDRIRGKVAEPYHKIQSRTTQLGRLQATCDLLRRIVRIQRLTLRLHSQLQGGVRDITKAAQSLSELDYLSQGVDLSGIEVLEEDRIFIRRAKEEVDAQARRLLEQGNNTLNQTHTATALQVYYNLGLLRTPIDCTCNDARESTKRNMKEALDIKALSKSTSGQSSNKVTGPGKVSGMPTPGNSAQFRLRLWSNIEILMDQISASFLQVIHLQKVLSKKRDPVTHSKFTDELLKNGGDVKFVHKFWVFLMENLKKELTTSNFVKQAFEGEYPKLLRLVNELWAKLSSHRKIIEGSCDVSSDKSSPFPIQSSIPDQSDDSYNSETELKSCLVDFERAYLQRSLSRLFDPINLVFPTGGRTPPSDDEIESIIKTIQSELNVASVDPALGSSVAKNVAKTIQLFAVKSEQLIQTQGDASQVIAPPTTAQSRNIAVVNSLYILQKSLLKLLAEQRGLQLEAIETVRASTECLSLLMAGAVQPLVSSVADAVEAIVLTMHNEDFDVDVDSVSGNTLCSLYVKELRDFLSRVVKDHFSQFTFKDFVMESLLPLGHRAIDLFVRHASLLTPLSEGGKMKLAADFAQMELAISPLCRRVTDLGASYRLLRAFRPLLFQSNDVIGDSPSFGDVIPFSTALHFLFSRAPADVRPPYQVMEWSVSRYSKWLDEHSSEKERLNMLRGALESYVNSVRSRQGTEFSDVYPIMVKLLQKGMEQY